jgi:hypothetical protein
MSLETLKKEVLELKTQSQVAQGLVAALLSWKEETCAKKIASKERKRRLRSAYDALQLKERQRRDESIVKWKQQREQWRKDDEDREQRYKEEDRKHEEEDESWAHMTAHPWDHIKQVPKIVLASHPESSKETKPARFTLRPMGLSAGEVKTFQRASVKPGRKVQFPGFVGEEIQPGLFRKLK